MSETIILVHGLWMTGIEFAVMRRRLEETYGFHCVPFRYRSVTGSLRQHLDALHELASRQHADRVHFVCHSLGGVVTYRLLESHDDLPPGRAVFMGSPLKGSAAAQVMARYKLGRMLVGHAANDELLEPRERHWDGRRDIGIIAGSSQLGLGRLLSPKLGEGSDGTVCIAETELDGAKDRIVLPVTHTGMMLSPAVAAQAACFLRTGQFDRTVAPGT